MIKVDLSKTIPPRLGAYLLGIVPGIFFLSSIALGNPHFAASVVSRAREIYDFGTYSMLALFLAGALLIGQAFIILAWILDLLTTSAFLLWRYLLRVTLGSQWLYGRFAKLQGFPPKQNRLIQLLGRVIYWARRRNAFSAEARPVLKCLHLAVRRLLKVRYGIDRSYAEDRDDGEWGAWYRALAKPLKQFQEAAMSARTLLACGLAGLAALYALPALRERYFIALCAIFTFAGCFTTVDLVRWRISLVKSSVVRLQSVLLQLAEVGQLTERRNVDPANLGVIEETELDSR